MPVPKSISPEISRLRPPAPPGAYPLFFGLALAAFGGYLALGGFGVLPLPDKVRVPYWVVGMVGISLVFGGGLLLERVVAGRAASRAQDSADRQWPWDFPWDAGGCTHTPAGQWRQSLLGLCFMGAFLLPFNWIALFHPDREIWVQLIVVLFDAIPATLLYLLLRQSLQYLKYGKSQIAFAHFPYAPGETVRFDFSPNRFSPITFTLRFLEETYQVVGSGEDEKTVSRCLMHWSAAQTLWPPPAAESVPVEFALPEETAWVTDFSDGARVRYWEVLAVATQPGLDFRASFLLPVYDCRPQDAVSHPRRPLPARPVLLRLPYLYETALPLAVLAIVAGLWIAPPAPAQRLAATLRQTWALSQVQDLLTHIPWQDVQPDAVAVRLAADGRLWLLSTYHLARFRGNDGENLLDAARFQSLFGKREALLSLAVTAPQEAWAGSRDGGLLHYKDGRWLREDTPLRRPVDAMAVENGVLYVAGEEGLWRRTPAGKLQRVEGADVLGPAQVLAGDGRGTLYAAFREELWRLRDGSWQFLWRGDTRDYEITALHPASDGSLFVGSHDGLHQLDATGQPLAHHLAGEWITAVLLDGEALWAGTWPAGGLRLRYHGRWSTLNEPLGLPAAGVSALAVDGQGRLWIALHSAGAWRLDAADILDALP